MDDPNGEVIKLEHIGASLRTINWRDVERLRNWKNSNMRFFFHQDYITDRGQLEWFHGYYNRTDDFVFIVMYRRRAIGCMGFRLKGCIDIYNVILGDKRFGGMGIMSEALQLMIKYILEQYYRINISAKVLLSNSKAIAWYTANGFSKHSYVNQGHVKGYVLMEQSKEV